MREMIILNKVKCELGSSLNVSDGGVVLMCANVPV